MTDDTANKGGADTGSTSALIASGSPDEQADLLEEGTDLPDEEADLPDEPPRSTTMTRPALAFRALAR